MSKYFEVSGDTVKAKFKQCPKCGPGYFMGEHKNRFYCGACHFTENKKK